MKLHKCEGCRFRAEHQEQGFRPFGVCSKEKNLIEAEKIYKAEICPYFPNRRRMIESGWNDAAIDFERFHRLREKTFAEIGKALEANDGYGKSYEGAFEIVLEYPNFYEDPDATSGPVVIIRLHCYILGPARHYEWKGKTFSEALTKAERDITAWIKQQGAE